MNLEQIKELIKVLEDSSLTTIEIEDNEQKVKLFKETKVVEQAAPATQVIPVQQHQEAVSKTESTEDTASAKTINAPMVGTFYKSPSPDKDPYVKVGDQVSADSVVCILEAMKLFNEIQAEVAGEITEILVEDGQMVEYGQPLFKVK
ncbi:acetyl-CoA carboxylase biotin carboxyl carrier protein [Macrococcus hajekii]|uniref:Biotin carboxyl carrier protein of acetyl-CoA carboxylase n=1 Tax=Macrococcus hajekii TaxID=198482 RepID=A0A4R6BM91_9STAP|nr:acetyl-CoA carboxylase biotin carboxyl carrier protein [Macrococcus hajekii]TDM02926.1 acetyl-CoA carboxylase biotin carboxyl carrier protein [Macrococcus hajekii]GGB04993.1 acetyl-CoA carboxylase biotin carboxyl carrier protein subunit [Macrococcus hajekii]